MSGPGVPGVRGYSRAEAAGISGRRYYEDFASPADSTCNGIPALRGDPAGEWLRANDPRLRPTGIADEIKSALAAVGLSVDEAKGVFRKSGGRPTRTLAAKREQVARALWPMWEDGRRRDLMAGALGCDRKTLGRMMSKPPHVS